MIVNLGKFHEVIFDKHKGNHTNQIKHWPEKNKAVSKVKLLGIETDDKLNFNHHKKTICTPT